MLQSSRGRLIVHVKRLRTFIVEDNPMILEGLSEALRDMSGVEIVGSAATQAEALAWFGDGGQHCDVVIIDIFLKAGSGFGVLEGLARLPSPPALIVLTNYPPADVRARCLTLGADRLFDKSTEIDELFAWFAERSAMPSASNDH